MGDREVPAGRREVEGGPSSFRDGRESSWKRDFRRIEFGWIRKLNTEGIGRMNFFREVEFVRERGRRDRPFTWKNSAGAGRGRISAMEYAILDEARERD